MTNVFKILDVLSDAHNVLLLILLLAALVPRWKDRFKRARLKIQVTVSMGALTFVMLLVVNVIVNPGADLEIVEPSPVVLTLPPVDLVPADTTDAEVASCIRDAERGIQFSRTFSVRGEARCPGGGCLFRSSSCNRETAYARYEAPAPYYLDGYHIENPALHHGGMDGIEVTRRDDEGRALAVSVRLVCDPPDYPGAPGGWSGATIAGTEYLRDAEERRAQIRADCVVEIGG